MVGSSQACSLQCGIAGFVVDPAGKNMEGVESLRLMLTLGVLGDWNFGKLEYLST